ncbi:MAG: NACHT domain-containing NTPase [Limisphaerales bacterium]
MDRLFSQAGYPVEKGLVRVDAKSQLSLEPLYRYFLRLQESATIPNYFPGVPEIPLDGFFVELSATEDLRGNLVLSGEPAHETPKSVDPVTHSPISSWRAAANQKRIPLETVVSATELKPAVVFGDPGSGKSTLMLYALHELGRGAVSGKGLAVANVIPFRISLREFARDGKEVEFQVIQYLIRKELGITDPTEFEDWRYLLSNFFLNERPFRLFLLVDGLDEVTPDPEVFKEVRKRMGEVTAIARVIFTSRRAGFLRPVNQFDSFELVELSELAMHELIGNWFTRVHERPPDFVQSFRNWIFSDPRHHEMGSNPCLLSLLCFLNQGCGVNEFIATGSRAALYQAAVLKLVEDPDRIKPTGLTASLATLSAFALDRYVSLGTAAIPIALFNREELRQFLARPRTEIECRGLDLGEDQLESIWLRTRLVSRWNLGEWHHFLHLTFQEYFAARWLVTRPDAEVGRLIELYRYNPYWREVWRFYAGLCSVTGGSGRARFNALIKGFAVPEDLFGQALFHLAPLVAEFGVGDTQEFLGFDLRIRLREMVLAGHNQTRMFIRRMVDVDPAYFLRYVRTRLMPVLQFYIERVDGPRPNLDPGEIRLGVEILECLYHPDAVRFQRELIQAELGFPHLQDSDLALGPTVPSGRNEMLGSFLEDCARSSLGPLQRHRAVGYLACVRSPGAGAAILDVARAQGGEGRGRQTKRRRQADLEFQVHCLWALCELGDTRAVILAQELWNEPGFREGSIGEVATFLAEIRSPAVPELAESWLEQGGDSMAASDLEPLLDLLKPWAERQIPPSMEGLLRRTDAGPSVRASIWEIICRRGGIHGEARLRRHLEEFWEPSRGEKSPEELVGILEFIAAQRLGFLRELEILLNRFGKGAGPYVQDAIWATATAVVLASGEQPKALEWLLDVAVPTLEKALLTPGQETGRLSHRLAAFRRAPGTVLEAIANMTRAVWNSVSPDSRLTLLQFFTDFPAQAPTAIVLQALDSDDQELKITAVEILAVTDPGRLMNERSHDPAIDQVLLRKSARDGTLYFTNGFYDPARRSFMEYSRIR